MALSAPETGRGRRPPGRRPIVFDGHSDTLTRIRLTGGRSFLERSDSGHLDLPRARDGGLAGGFFAIFTASPGWRKIVQPAVGSDGEPRPGEWTVPLPPALDRRHALDFTMSVLSDLHRLVEQAEGAMEVVRTAARLRQCLEDGTFAVVLHIEGAEAIDTELEALDVFYDAGLRSLGLVWSRPNAFASGVSFDFPRSPDTGPGLTAAGRRLVRRCNELGVLVDLSHLNGRGFRDVAELSDAPLVATHSNAFALSSTPRNLTDEQLDTIAGSGGVVGLNFAVGFLRQDGRTEVETPIRRIAEHARYIADRVGVDHVALGSDFDGALVPSELGDAAGLPALLGELSQIGFHEEEVARIAYENWVRVLDATWR